MMIKNKKILIFFLGSCFLFLGFKIVDNRFEVSKNLEIFAAVYKEIDLTYVDETKPGEIMRKGIDAMLGSLDPYTVFYSEAQAEDAFTQRTGEYGGLGIYVTQIEDYLVITDVFEGYSAQTAGIKIGDKIINVNGKNFIGKTTADLSPVMKGARGSFVSLELDRPGEGRIEKKVERVEVKVKNVPFYGKVNDKTGYIHLTNFMQNAATEVSTALTDLKKQGCENLILDLRDNPGGLLLEAVDIVNLFIPKNELVVFTKGRTNSDYYEYKTNKNPQDLTIPMVVLINERSASASEIVSGTLQDLDRAVVVGVNSFGKGLVQTTRQLPFRSQMKITTAKYYTPSGRCIQALDYSNRNEDGSVGKVADSLRQEFKTKKGRSVFDGGGILPDQVVALNPNQAIVKQLLDRKIIFDFAVDYLSKQKPKVDAHYQFPATEFIKFVNFSMLNLQRIRTNTDISIENLEKSVAKDEIKQVTASITQLKQALIANKSEQIRDNQNELIDLISLEIIRVQGLESHYYRGKFTKDVTTIKAIDIVENNNKYQKYLN